MPITERILLCTESSPRLSHLRITASRDYHLRPEKCVETEEDGITLRVDLSKSDLMLETELRRFAEPIPRREPAGLNLFRVTCQSLAKAFDQGLSINALEDWYRQRTGEPPPPAVRLLLRAAGELQLVSRRLVVVTTESPLVTDGLIQHPSTAGLLGERLGPTTFAVAEHNLPALQQALSGLGIELDAGE